MRDDFNSKYITINAKSGVIPSAIVDLDGNLSNTGAYAGKRLDDYLMAGEALLKAYIDALFKEREKN